MTYLSTLLAAQSNEASARTRHASTFLGRALDGLRRWSLRQQTISELSSLSDEQLRDIGLDRADLGSAVERQLDELRRF